MISKILSEIRKKDMIKAGDRVIVGLSGGADSVALLCVLKQLEEELEITVCACHVNHNLRGEESERDQKFCENLCKEKNVPLTVASVDVIGFCRDNGVSTEEGARKLRYQALQSIANNAKIATAHTLSDNAETVLLNLARGSSLDGLCGIPPVRDNIIRPLICCTRSEIESFLGDMGQEFVTDSSNLTDDYRRNKIRRHAIPILKDFNDSLEETIGRNSEVLREEKELLDSLTVELEKNSAIKDEMHINKAFERFGKIYPVKKRFDANILRNAPKPLRLRLLRKILSSLSLRYDFNRLIAIDEMIFSGGIMDLGGGNTFECDAKTVSFIKTFVPFDFEQREITTDDISTFKISVGGGYSLGFKPLSLQEIKLFVNKRNLQFKNAIDCDKINNIVMLRKRKPGDGYHPIGRGCRQSFKNLLNAASLPMAVRDSLAVLADADGVIWLEGFSVAQRAALTTETKRAVLPVILED